MGAGVAEKGAANVDVGMKAEAKELLKLAAPIIATNCLSFLMNVVDLAMVGEL